MLSLIVQGLRAREERIALRLHARVRLGNGWEPACIYNASEHGMLVAVAEAPAEGALIELRCGRVTIKGRVSWRGRRVFGLRARNPIDLLALKAMPCAVGAGEAPGGVRIGPQARLARRAEHDREAAGRGQLVCLLLGGMLGSAAIGAQMPELFAHPIVRIEAALSR